jgi:hypothetical protein
LIRPGGATWRSGYAAVCKTVYSGSIPDVASNEIKYLAEYFRVELSSSAFRGRVVQVPTGGLDDEVKRRRNLTVAQAEVAEPLPNRLAYSSRHGRHFPPAGPRPITRPGAGTERPMRGSTPCGMRAANCQRGQPTAGRLCGAEIGIEGMDQHIYPAHIDKAA